MLLHLLSLAEIAALVHLWQGMPELVCTGFLFILSFVCGRLVETCEVIKLSIFLTPSSADSRHFANFILKFKLSKETLQNAHRLSSSVTRRRFDRNVPCFLTWSTLQIMPKAFRISKPLSRKPNMYT